MPKSLNFGAGEIVELNYLCTIFNIKRRTAALYLKALGIKPMYIGNDMFFSLPTLKRILFVLSLPGSPGFLFPGSKGKNRQRLVKDEGYITEVTDELLEKASKPDILAQMVAAEGRDINVIKQFIKNPVGRPKGNKNDSSS